MGSKYYYLVASLPVLEFGEKTTISYEAFFDDCSRILSERDFQLICQAKYNQDSGPNGQNALFDSWAVFNRNLHNEIVRFRAAKNGKDPSQYLHGEAYQDPFIAQEIAQAAKGINLLATERALDIFRWKKLDDLLQGHHFDFEVLIVYALKLQILQRHQEISSSSGHDTFVQYKEFKAPQTDSTQVSTSA